MYYFFVLNYIALYTYLIVVILLALVIIVLSRIVGPRIVEREKLSAYECGFEPFNPARSNFDIGFIKVGVLYLLFDLEIIFLIPWVLYYRDVGIYGFFTLCFFLILLFVGFIYEWLCGSLDWD